MIRLRPRRGHRALDDVQPAHLAGIGIAAFGEIARITRLAGEPSQEEIRIQREYYVGSIELVNGLNRLAQGHPRTFINIVPIYRLVDMPLRFRVDFEN